LQDIKNFNKTGLKPTETVVRTQVVLGNTPAQQLGHGDDLEIIEYFDEPEEFRRKCVELAHMIRDSQHCVVYTGAGISTSAKIPDYRGPDGAWTLRDRGLVLDATRYVTIEQAIPTLSHMAITELVNRGMVKCVVSTNVDGLHVRSGIPRDRLAELHGNSYLEICNDCKKHYFRTFDVNTQQDEHTAEVNIHYTGRQCEECGGNLYDSIIHFNETLPVNELAHAREESEKGDLAIVVGTSMRVRPACELPRYIYRNNGGKMVICNLQTTGYDNKAELLVRGHCDDVFHLIMQELGIPIPQTIPEGFTIPEYIDDIDNKHNTKIEQVKKQLERIKQR